MKSAYYRNKYMLYWRWVGHDCDPNDTDQCVDWDVEYRWFYEGAEEEHPRFMNVLVQFEGDKPLLPWEAEHYTVSYEDGRVAITVGGASYEYAQEGPIVDQMHDRATIILRPGKKILTQPEEKAVTMSLVNNGGKLQLLVDDSRTSYYAGEALEIAVAVRYDARAQAPWYKKIVTKNPTVFERSVNGPIRIVVQAGRPRQLIDVTGVGSKGSYWIDSWSFRRAASKISSGDWIDRGQGNQAQY